FQLLHEEILNTATWTEDNVAQIKRRLVILSKMQCQAPSSARKVNLLGLARAQISGQYSAILNNQTKYYSSYSARSLAFRPYNGRSDDFSEEE
ncbi:hypothetical protein HPP92_023327, partial [Vanilla planifolia]